MRFHAPKRYGQSKLSNCTFCGRTATQKTEAGLEVCYLHTKEQLQAIKCICGGWLEQCSGKFGPYFNCLRCGNINFKKVMRNFSNFCDARKAEKKESSNYRINSAFLSGMEMKASMPKEKVSLSKAPPQKSTPKEIIITSRDVEYFD